MTEETIIAARQRPSSSGGGGSSRPPSSSSRSRKRSSSTSGSRPPDVMGSSMASRTSSNSSSNRRRSSKSSSSSGRPELNGADGLSSSMASRSSRTSHRSQSSRRSSSRRSSSSRGFLKENDWNDLITSVRPAIEKNRRRTSRSGGAADPAANATVKQSPQTEAELTKQSAYKILQKYGQQQIKMNNLKAELKLNKAELSKYKKLGASQQNAQTGETMTPSIHRRMVSMSDGAETLSEMVAKWESQKRDAEAAQSAAAEDAQSLKEEIEKLKADLQEARGEARELSLQVWEQKTEIKDLKEQLEEAQEENADLTEIIHEMDGEELESGASRQKELKAENDSLKARVTELEAKLTKAESDGHADLKRLREERDQFEERCESLSNELATKKQRVIDLTTEVLDMKRQLAQHELNAQNNPLVSFFEKNLPGMPTAAPTETLKNENWKLVKKSISLVAKDVNALKAAAAADSDVESEAETGGWENVRTSMQQQQQQEGGGWDMLFSAAQGKRQQAIAAKKLPPKQTNFMAMLSLG